MKNHTQRKTRLIILGLMLCGAALLTGCGEPTAAESPPTKQMVYVDVKSKAVVIAPHSTDAPAVNPKTGQRTLMPALYCAKCKRWHPAPPLEIRQRNPAAGKCPKCRQPLTTDGPWPEK